MRPSAAPVLRLLALASSLTLVAAQNNNNNAGPQMPSTSDDAPGSDSGSDSSSTGSDSLVNYYFVFLALLICLAGFGAFMLYRRRRKRGANIRNSREHALERDVSAWDPTRARRRYWQGRWLSADMSREEGLNEHGEAPPPYVPKPSDEEAAAGLPDHSPTIPLQALSREQAGLKPPDYAETDVRPLLDDDRRRSSFAPTASSSHSAEHPGHGP